MNYYAHHLGDYAAATSHLSWDEDMAYTRLLRAYYQHEKPLPLDVKELCRLARATSSAQRKALDSVLHEFFVQLEDGWHQKRCDEEIARYQEKREKAQRSAEARWSGKRSDSDGNANASGGGMRTHSERIETKDANALPTQCEGNAPNPNPNPNPNPKIKDRARALAEARAVRGVNLTAFDRWIGYRDERKPAIKTVSLVACAEQLAKLGADDLQASAVQNSIANGYQGLIPLKVNGNGAHAQTAPVKYRTADEIEAEERARGDWNA